jgi:hypothetical protein
VGRCVSGDPGSRRPREHCRKHGARVKRDDEHRIGAAVQRESLAISAGCCRPPQSACNVPLSAGRTETEGSAGPASDSERHVQLTSKRHPQRKVQGQVMKPTVSSGLLQEHVSSE